ncbi:hypothetical protein YC2023_056058 [Brassica napus]
MGSTPFSTDRSWDEKGKNMISNIYGTFDDYGIQSLQFIYFHEGVHVESEKHGYSGGQHIKRLKLVEIDPKIPSKKPWTGLLIMFGTLLQNS